MFRYLTPLILTAAAFGQTEEEPAALPFAAAKCPCDAKLGGQATLKLPEGFRFVDAANAPKFMEYTENLVSGNELGIAISDRGWFVVFMFNDVGYIKDDEKDTLDAAELMKAKTEMNAKGNEQRRERGWPEVEIAGWHEKPFYNQATNNLEWSVIIAASGEQSINHSSRYLGRRGVMNVNLVSNPDGIQQDLPAFRAAMKGFEFTPDNQYSAFRKGDKVAEYGLSALVLGGAAAAAAKTGLLKSLVKLLAAFWKVILIGLIAFGGAILRLFRRPAPAEEVEPAEEPSR
jgi:uncharacterized membrane-anchored protein